MATMYSLFFGFLLAALCRGNGDGSRVVGSGFQDFFIPSNTHPSFSMTRTSFFSLMKKTKQKKSRLGQYEAKYFLTGLNISEPLRFATLHRSVFNDLQEIFLTLYYPRSFYLDNASSTSLQLLNLSPAKFLTIAVGCRTFVSKVLSDEFFASFFAEKKEEPRHGLSGIRGNRSGMEDKRNLIITIASAELGIKEVTGHNDGPRVEQYLRYTNLGPGYDWCAAFVSWVYGQAGLAQPRNPWSPALFPKARSYKDTDKIQQADLFGIYSAKLKRINHVGLIKEKQGQYILSIEGNSNNRVESRRRHQRTIHSYADWVDRS